MSMGILIVIGVAVVALLSLVLLFVSRYKTASSSNALVITGSYLGSKNTVETNKRKVKIITGGGAFVLPVFQKEDTIDLRTVKLPINGRDVYTVNGVQLSVVANAIVKIGNSIEEIATAAEQFPAGIEEIQIQSKEVLEGHLRSILGKMTVEEIYKDRDKFSQEVQKIAVADLNKMGLQIISFTISEINDKNGYLDALGKEKIAEVKKVAEIAEANALRETSVERAKAEEAAQKAEIEKNTKVAEYQKDMEIKKAEYRLEQDKKKAEADIAYQVQEAISKQEVVEAQMTVQKIEKDREIELQERDIELKKKELDATIKNQADADLYKRQKAAEAARFEEEQRAKASAIAEIERAKAAAEADKARAEAEAAAERAKGLAEAEIKKATGEAEAEAEKAKTDILRAQGEAEAKAEAARIANLEAAGLAEAKAIEARGAAEVKIAKEKAEIEVDLQKGLADAALKQGELRSIELITKALPEIAGKIAEPFGNVDKITILDQGNGDGMDRMTSTVTNIMHKLPTVVEDLSGVKLGQLLSNVTKGRLNAESTDVNKLIEIAQANPELVQMFLQNKDLDLEGLQNILNPKQD